MATHSSDITTPADDRTEFKQGAKLTLIGAVVAVVALVVALILGFGSEAGESPLRPFLFGYLAAYVFGLTIALGALAFVLLQHLTRAGWSVSVRRTAENFAATLPLMGLLGLPIIIAVLSGNGTPYRWALPYSRASEAAIKAAEHNEAELEPETAKEKLARSDAGEATWRAPSAAADFTLDPLVLAKRSYGLFWLQPWFFIVRIIFYLAVWSMIALWFRRTSITQDRTSDDSLTLKMQARAAPCLVILALTMTGAAFDLIMSLDPHWYSTMFGVYYIANSFLSSYAVLIISLFLLQRAGYLQRSVTIEHFHDLGKFLFAFTFFYGYIAFSQYMLMWYANIPEETEWMARHGASTAIVCGWNKVIVTILICHILIPFAALMSRHVKRRPHVLVLWALWQLLFVGVDMYWLVMPEIGETSPHVKTLCITIFAMVGMLGVLLAGFGRLAGQASLRATHDPRLADSLVFQNI